ncbi:MAG: UvrD-helicase domain-containing protein [Limisphaera sp.]
MLTEAQKRAVEAPGNVLVMAGAGTGKTRTLVERVLRVLVPPEDSDRLTAGVERVCVTDLLVVTFTEAAAAELRERIRQRLETLAGQETDLFWHQQLALLDNAFIGTLHSFCYRLVTEHYAELHLDPKLVVLDAGEAALRSHEVFHELLEEVLSESSPRTEALRFVFREYFDANEARLRDQVLRVHAYSQSLADPDAWFESQKAYLEDPNPTRWREWLQEAFRAWQARWKDCILALSPDDSGAACWRELLDRSAAQEPPAGFLEDWAVRYRRFQAALAKPAKGRSTPNARGGDLRRCLEELQFLGSLLPAAAGSSPEGSRTDPLGQDWEQMRKPMAALLDLVRRFDEAYTAAKRQRGELDFADLEQMALTLLWDRRNQRPRPLGERLQHRFRWVFVDEYQDINPAQDLILRAVSRTADPPNRFLVGDVKQSIYRFRRADPAIFRQYAEAWARAEDSHVVQLTENFRSRAGLLEFVNEVFSVLMHPEVGGVTYGREAWLRSPLPPESPHADEQNDPPVEIHLWTSPRKGATGAGEAVSTEDAEEPAEEFSKAEREARFLAGRLRQLREEPLWVRDPQTGERRPVRYSDMAVLLRSPSPKIEAYVRAFEAMHVPLEVTRRGFFETREVADLLHLLQILDNPLQDLPLLAVLRSPLVGLSLDELAWICRQDRSLPVWLRLHRWLGAAEKEDPAGPDLRATRLVLTRFLRRYERWRQLARQGSVSRCLEEILNETCYLAWIATQPRGRLARQHVEWCLEWARQYDRSRGEGLHHFLARMEDFQEEAIEPEVPSTPGVDAVRLLSIHQSKGLEFPVVVVADLGKSFNKQDLQGDVILDEQYGLAARLRSRDGTRTYPSLSYWLARQRQTREMLGEELRLLYVALTRARDRLILSGETSNPQGRERQASLRSNVMDLLSARCVLDWLLPRLRDLGLPSAEERLTGSTRLFQWTWHEETGPGPRETVDAHAAGPNNEETPFQVTPEIESWVGAEAERLLGQPYAWMSATRVPAKTSVTAAQRQVEEEPMGRLYVGRASAQRRFPRPPLTAVERGTAHHRFLRWFPLDTEPGVASFRAAANTLVQQGRLTAEEVAVLDYEALVRFWGSDLGRRLRAVAGAVHREHAFTVALEANEIRRLVGQPVDPTLEGERVVVQGAADLVALLPDQVWVVDFKTDQLKEAELDRRVETYAPQLRLYALALSRIYRRPVRRLCLHFLSVGKTVELLGGGETAAGPSASVPVGN